jgi:hypothetical protein
VKGLSIWIAIGLLLVATSLPRVMARAGILPARNSDSLKPIPLNSAQESTSAFFPAAERSAIEGHQSL